MQFNHSARIQTRDAKRRRYNLRGFVNVDGRSWRQHHSFCSQFSYVSCENESRASHATALHETAAIHGLCSLSSNFSQRQVSPTGLGHGALSQPLTRAIKQRQSGYATPSAVYKPHVAANSTRRYPANSNRYHIATSDNPVRTQYTCDVFDSLACVRK